MIEQIRERLKINRNKRITLEETAKILLETEMKLEKERLARIEGDKKLEEEKTQYTHFIETIIPQVLSKIPIPQDGITPVINYSLIISEVSKRIPKPKNGKDGKGVDIDIIIKDILSRIPKTEIQKVEITGKEMIEKINELKITSELQIDKSHIKGLQEFLESITRKLTNLKVGRKKGGGGDIVYLEDLSAQTDGVTKVFTVPVHRKALQVIGSDFPTAMFSGNGFTTSGMTLTLTTTNAPSSGSQLGFLYVV